jgi:ferrochelatase
MDDVPNKASTMTRTGVLLINLGTPDSASPRDVYRYLTEFLNDPRVIDLPKPLRALLTNVVIVPFRHRQSAEAYAKIWTPAGSPLLVNGLKLKEALSEQLGSEYQVALGMRYGKPSIAAALHELRHCKSIRILPLFPQYASAATGSALQRVLEEFAHAWNIPAVSIQNDFYDHPGFINAYAAIIKQYTDNTRIEHTVFSYHGLPERHINKSECQATCDRTNACPAITTRNQYCYRAQCYRTTESLAGALGLSAEKYSVGFQSRLGRTPWIKPYTDLVLPALREKNIKHIAIVCPSFVADCLETLEEINIRARADWQALGGGDFVFVPCLNGEPMWIAALKDMILNPGAK